MLLQGQQLSQIRHQPTASLSLRPRMLPGVGPDPAVMMREQMWQGPGPVRRSVRPQVAATRC